MKTRFTTATAVLAAAIAAGLVTGCEDSDFDQQEAQAKPETTQRDVYKTLDECMQDWGDKEMCSQAANAQAEALKAQAQAQANQAAGGGAAVHPVPVMVPMFYGPEYSTGHRVIYRNGGEYTPKANHSFKSTPKLAPSKNFNTTRQSFFKANPTKAPSGFRTGTAGKPTSILGGGRTSGISRGGFGGTGRGFGGRAGG